MYPFIKIRVWHASGQLVEEIYKVTARFPRDERFRITDQIRDAAASVQTNIAEGSKSESQADFARFLNYSEKSLTEVQSLLKLSKRLGFIIPEDFERIYRLTLGIARMLHALKVKVQAQIPA